MTGMRGSSNAGNSIVPSPAVTARRLSAKHECAQRRAPLCRRIRQRQSVWHCAGVKSQWGGCIYSFLDADSQLITARVLAGVFVFYGRLRCTWYNQVALDKSRSTGSAGSRLRGEDIGSTVPAIVCFVKSNIKSGNFSTQKCEKCVAAYFGRTMNVRQNTANRLKSIYNMTKF